MKLALSLATTVSGQTSPNPPVGAVIVKNGRVVGMGVHLQAGDSHAEVVAAEMAGVAACEDADIYVTLEPCAHIGKTPPCANLLIERRFRRVYVAVLDPNPLVAGKGIALLKEAELEVEVGVCEREVQLLYRPFFHYIRTKTPYVTLKTAMTLDGKIATYTGNSQWITSKTARLDVHFERHRHDAILVGIETILHDSPLLTTRLPQGGNNPIRIVLDTHLRIPLDAKVVTDRSAQTIVFCGRHASEVKNQQLKEAGVEVVRLSSEQIEIETVLVALGQRGVMTLLVEGGSAVNGSFIQQKAIQRVIVYMAPKLIGGKDALTAVGGVGLPFIADALSLSFEQIEQLGPDVKLVATVAEGSDSTCLPE